MDPSYSMSNFSLRTGADQDVNGKLRLIEVLDIRLHEIRDLSIRHNPLSSSASSSSTTGSDRTVFCVVKLDREEIFRSSAARTQNPTFGDDFHLEAPKNFTYLSFHIYDQIPNRVARPIGRVTFRKQDLARYSGQDRWWRLKPMNRHSDVTGKIWLEITRTPTPVNTDGAAESDSTVAAHQSGHLLSIRILDYCDLNQARSSDLFSVVCLQSMDGSETKKLRMRRKSLPTPATSIDGNAAQSTTALCSQDAATFVLKPSSLVGGLSEESWPVLRISVWHDILGSFSSYFHGEARLKLDDSFNAQLDSQQPFRAWYSLTPRTSNGNVSNNNNIPTQSNAYGSESSSSGDVFASVALPPSSSNNGKEGEQLGALRLKISYSVDHILPTHCYNELWSRLLDALSVQPLRCSVIGLLASLPRMDLERAARPLIRIFLHSEQLPTLIRVLCTEEIAQCQDVNTLFRNTSLASKCIYELMKLVGQQYLISTLKPVVERIFAEKRCCEVDPTRLNSSSNIEDNTMHLIHYTELALSRILDSSHRCPPILKEVFRILREVTQRYYPDKIAIQWLVLSSFLIMRFFAAALLSPKMFCLKRENAEPAVQRTLTLISKVIQRLTNYVVVGRTLTEKEPFLTPVFERFTDENHRLGFIKFFERISCAGGENSITGESITVLKEGVLHERIPKRTKKNAGLLSEFSSSSSSSSFTASSSLCFNFRNVLQRTASKPRYCYLTETEFSWYKDKGQQMVGRMSLGDVKIVQPAKELFNNPLVLEIRSDRCCVFLETSNELELTEWTVALQRASKRQRLTQQQLTENAAQLYEIDLDQQLETIHMIFLDNYELLKAWEDSLRHGVPLPQNTPSYDGYLTNVDDSGRQTFYNSLVNILPCMESLESMHVDHFQQIGFGTKDLPICDDNYLLLGTRIRDYAMVRGDANDPCPLDTKLEKALAPPLPPKPATTAMLHYSYAGSSLDL